MSAPPPRPPQRPPQKAPSKPQAQPKRTLSFAALDTNRGEGVGIYGVGGAGKTTLVDGAPGPIASFDLDNSLAVLRLPNTRRVDGIGEWSDLLDVINGDGWNDVKTLVIDSITVAEEMATRWVIKNVPHSKGLAIKNIEDYGWGIGYRHIYDAFVALLAALDRHKAAGRNVVLVCHQCVVNVPNPSGEDWLRYEPRLQGTKYSIRLRVHEWVDHMLFLGYDIDVKDGKGKGSGTRTLWPVEMPHCMAKSRTLADPIPIYPGSNDVWDALFNKGEKP